jgi:predicted AAA+ superfamily ATPase
MFYERRVAGILRRRASQRPVVWLSGPRQAGKTTLLKKLFAARRRYVSFDAPDVRERCRDDPRLFLESLGSRAILDEVQYVPELLDYIKESVDRDRAPGRFLLTGSQNFQLMDRVAKALAGRVGLLTLYPLSLEEMGCPAGFPALWKRLHRGFYPELAASPRLDGAAWQGDYLQTYIERDVRGVLRVGSLRDFTRFIIACAARNAQILSLSDLARDVGVAVSTAKQWLSVLEASFQAFLLPPYFTNVTKRIVKSPKLYLLDTGLLCYLLKLETPEVAMRSAHAGAIFESFVVGEILKAQANRGRAPELYYWRTSYGAEVDVVLRRRDGLVPVEVKLHSRPGPAMAGGIAVFRKTFPGLVRDAYMAAPVGEAYPIGASIRVLPPKDLPRLA